MVLWSVIVIKNALLWDKYKFLREARSIFPRKGSEIWSKTLETEKFSSVLLVLKSLEWESTALKEAQEKPWKNQENFESIINKNVDF